MKFYIIGERETVTGFSLVGIEGAAINSKSEALQALKNVLNRKDIGIILITERAAKEIQAVIDELLFKKKCQLILQIPDVNGALRCTKSLEEFVLAALGIKV